MGGKFMPINYPDSSFPFTQIKDSTIPYIQVQLQARLGSYRRPAGAEFELHSGLPYFRGVRCDTILKGWIVMIWSKGAGAREILINPGMRSMEFPHIPKYFSTRVAFN